MRRLLDLQERQEAAQSPRGAKWGAVGSLGETVEMFYRDVRALVRAVKAQDEAAADAAAAQVLGDRAKLEGRLDELESAFSREAERAAA